MGLNTMGKGNNIFILRVITPLVLVLCGISFNACSSGEINMNVNSENACLTPAEKPEWLGKKLSDAVAKLGSPSAVDEFNMKEAIITEFRGKLEQLFPDARAGKETVIIKEASWQQGDCNLTLWFKKSGNSWEVVDTLYWHKDTDF